MKKIPNVLYKCNEVYAISLNPIDKYQFAGKPDRWKKFTNFIHGQLISWRYDYYLFTEISEPKTINQGQIGPRLHLHGTIIFESKKQIQTFLLHSLYQLSRWCRIDIDTIDDIDHWTSYMTKQQDIMPEGGLFSRKYILENKPKVPKKGIYKFVKDVN